MARPQRRAASLKKQHFSQQQHHISARSNGASPLNKLELVQKRFALPILVSSLGSSFHMRYRFRLLLVMLIFSLSGLLYVTCFLGIVPGSLCRLAGVSSSHIMPLINQEVSVGSSQELLQEQRPREAGPRLYSYDIIKSYPHDADAFTQGLLYVEKNIMYESTGLYGRSSVRKVDLETGKVLKIQTLAHHHFGEGLTLVNRKLLQVLWKTNEGFVYDLDTLKPVDSFKTPMSDGWGLTEDGTNVIGSDGSDTLYFFDPNTYREVKRVQVRDGDRPVAWLNELEYIEGEIWANIWQRDCIARISPEDGQVLGWVLMHGLKDYVRPRNDAQNRPMDVLNGIAWDKQGQRLFVTGKLWSLISEIKVREISWPGEMNLQNARMSCIM